MENYKLSSQKLYHILKEKNVEFLHHANTVSTSITFIENNALLSRSYVELNDLHQINQKSDNKDKELEVWDHVFLDGEDLHKSYSRANKYGPVLFRISIDVLKDPDFSEIYITKTNPWYWNDDTEIERKFYDSLEDFNNDYLTNKRLNSLIMFTFKTVNKKLKLNKYLHSIGIDRPKLLVNLTSGEQITAGDHAIRSITEALKYNKLEHVPVLIRHINKLNFCSCHLDYN